jgi:hypothetical protein
VEKISADFLWKGASWLAAVWAVSFAYFAGFVAVPKYRRTLWSSTSARELVLTRFTAGTSEEQMFHMFKMNMLIWEGDIGTEVKAWTMGNWERWVEEKPDWFTENVSHVPDEYIPPRFLEGLGGAGRERRGSAVLSVRESMRGSARRRSESGEGAEEGE